MSLIFNLYEFDQYLDHSVARLECFSSFPSLIYILPVLKTRSEREFFHVFTEDLSLHRAILPHQPRMYCLSLAALLY